MKWTIKLKRGDFLEILVIPAEGDNTETETWYMNDVRRRYENTKVSTLGIKSGTNIGKDVDDSIRHLFDIQSSKMYEIHAQGGFSRPKIYKKIVLYAIITKGWLCSSVGRAEA